MKKILSKQHIRTKSVNRYVNNISKLTNYDDEQFNFTSRDVNQLNSTNKIDISKDNSKFIKKSSTCSKKELYKIDEIPKENSEIYKKKSKSLNNTSIKKLNNNEKSKEKLVSDEKVINQINLTIKYYKKKLDNQMDPQAGNYRSIKNLFNSGGTLSSQRNSINDKSSYNTINNIKKPIDTHLLKDKLSKSETIIKNIQFRKLEVIKDNRYDVIEYLNNVSIKTDGENAIKNSTDLITNKNVINLKVSNTPYQTTPLKNNYLANNMNEKLKLNDLCQSTNIKTTINTNILSFNNYTKNFKTGNYIKSSFNKKFSSDNEINKSYLKISKKDFTSKTIVTSRPNSNLKNSIVFNDFKNEPTIDNQSAYSNKACLSKCTTVETKNESIKNNYKSNLIKCSKQKIISSHNNKQDQIESENTIISKTTSKDSLNFDESNKKSILSFNTPANNLVERENNYKSNFDEGRKIQSIIDDIFKESFMKHSRIDECNDFSPKKHFKVCKNENEDENSELKKTIKWKIPNGKGENKVSDFDKTLVLDELNNRIDLINIPNSFFINRKGNDCKIENDDYSCGLEFSKDFDESCSISGEERIKITKLPMFKSKILSSYNSNSIKQNLNIFELGKRESQFIMNTSLKTLLKYNSSIKENIFSFLDFHNLIHFSSCSKYLRKETNVKIYAMLINLIFNHNNAILRLKIWKSLFRYTLLNNSNLKLKYENLCLMKSPFEDEIKKDLLRTIPEDPTFKKGKTNYIKLKNILIAFSNYNPNIGYAQGLNFIVANSLYIFNEEEVKIQLLIL